MRRYFFSCEGAIAFKDQDWTELLDDRAARHQAVINAGEILRDHPEDFADNPTWRMTVVDEAGDIAFTFEFKATGRLQNVVAFG